MKNNIRSFISFVNLWGNSFFVNLNKNKLYLYNQLSKSIGCEAAQLIFSMVFGVEQQFSSKLHHDFNVMGMLHILSASGFNVSLMVSVVTFLLKVELSKKKRFCLLLISIIFYFYLSSQGVSLQRAVIMMVLALGLRLVFLRQSDSGRNLVYTAVLLVVVSPDLLESIGYQFSILATGAIIWIYPYLKTASRGKFAQGELLVEVLAKTTGKSGFKAKLTGYFQETFLITLVVNLVLFPLVVYHFEEFSLLTLPCNLLLLWLVPLITVSGLCWMVIYQIFLWLGLTRYLAVFNFLLWLQCHFLITVADFFGRWDWAVIKMPKIGLSVVLAWWIGLLALLKLKTAIIKKNKS
ncbi:MAG: ComEC/Rec2 family competence protein [Patescibacteria group bacterium]|nr:ComEC/Rec2 family competence protein [Patescibacteria group bacterium]